MWERLLRIRWALIAAILFGGLLFSRISTMTSAERHAKIAGRWAAERTALSAAKKLENELVMAELVVRELASAESVVRAADYPAFRTHGSTEQNSSPAERDPVFDAIRAARTKYPDFYHVGVLYLPSNGKLYAPTVHKLGGKVDEFYRETLGDYTKYDWFRAGLAGARWLEPALGKLTGKNVLNYVAPIKSSSGEVCGVAIGSISLAEGVSQMVGRVAVGQDGYLFLVSKGGKYLYDPNIEYTARQLSLLDVARQQHDPLKARLAAAVAAGKPAFGEGRSGLTGQATWVFLRPVGATGMFCGLTVVQEYVGAGADFWRKTTIEAGALTLLFLLCAGQALCRQRGLVGICGHWKGVAATSSLLAGGIVLTWAATLRWSELHASNARRVFDTATARSLLVLPRRGGESLGSVEPAELVVASVGVHWESFAFNQQGEASLGGLIWERREDGNGDPTQPVPLEFPGAVNVKLSKWTTQTARGYILHLAAFELTLRQPHKNPSRYPLDNRQIELRIRPADAFSSVGLIPDFNAFPIIAPAAKPGLASDLSASGWIINNAFFAMKKLELASLPRLEELTATTMPELRYTVQLRRRFVDAFVSALLPAMVVAALLFVFVFNITMDNTVAGLLGYKHMDSLRSMAALLFPALVAQINVRTRTPAEELLYVDYFYFVLYAAILLASCVVVWIGYGARIPWAENGLKRFKLLFWPALMGAYYAITFLKFWD